MKHFAHNFLKTLLLTGLCLFLNLATFAQQCSVTITNTGNVNACLPAVLNASSTAGITQIQWLQGNTLVNTANTTWQAGVIVAGNGTAGGTSSQLSSPWNAFVAADGSVYVPDQLNHRIQKWAPGASSGTTVAGGNGKGSNANQLSGPLAIYVDASGTMYIADAGNYRIQKWLKGATSGTTAAGGNGQGSKDNQLFQPRALAVNAKGDIFISDNFRIMKWSPGATTGITIIGGNGSGADLNQIFYDCFYLDKNDNIYVALAGKFRKYSPVNNYYPVIFGYYRLGSGSSGIWVDDLGRVYNVGTVGAVSENLR